MAVLKTLTVNGTKYNVTAIVPAASVTLLAARWVSEGDMHHQVVSVSDVTAHTKVDLQPEPDQLTEFHYLTLGFVAENDGGVVTVYAIGDRPTKDYTIQVTLTEVGGTGKIRGNTVGTTMPKANLEQDDPSMADYVFGKEEFLNRAATFPTIRHDIIPEQTAEVSFYGHGSDDGLIWVDWNFCYCEELTPGETYTVVFNGEVHTCVAKEIKKTELTTYIVLGNAALANFGEDTGEPFTIAQNDGAADLFTNVEGVPTGVQDRYTHNVRVYQTVDRPLLPIVTGDDEGKVPQVVNGKLVYVNYQAGSSVELDDTLNESGKAADAKAVGDAIKVATNAANEAFARVYQTIENLSSNVLVVTVNPETLVASHKADEIIDFVRNDGAAVLAMEGFIVPLAGLTSESTPVFSTLLMDSGQIIQAVAMVDNDAKVVVNTNMYEGSGNSECPLPDVTTEDNGKIPQVVDGQLVYTDVASMKVGEVTLETYIGNAIDSYIEEALGGDY